MRRIITTHTHTTHTTHKKTRNKGAFPARPGLADGANATASLSYVPGAPQLVPVHSVQDGEDFLIRGYTKCPAYAKRLDDWFGSAEFKAKARLGWVVGGGWRG